MGRKHVITGIPESSKVHTCVTPRYAVLSLDSRRKGVARNSMLYSQIHLRTYMVRILTCFTCFNYLCLLMFNVL